MYTDLVVFFPVWTLSSISPHTKQCINRLIFPSSWSQWFHIHQTAGMITQTCWLRNRPQTHMGIKLSWINRPRTSWMRLLKTRTSSKVWITCVFIGTALPLSATRTRDGDRFASESSNLMSLSSITLSWVLPSGLNSKRHLVLGEIQ